MKRNTFLAAILNLPAAVINRVAWLFLKVHRAEINGDAIELHRGLFLSQKIQVSEIRQWSVHPEMGCDVVQIEFTDGESLVWMDKYDDLIQALRKLASGKEIESAAGK